MAKISNNRIQVYHKDIEKDYDIVIMYNQWHHFFAVIPAEFQQIIHHFSEEENRKLSIVNQRISKYKVLPDSYVIESETEGDCLSKTKDALKVLVDKSIQQRKVIIVFFNPKDVCQYNNHEYNKEHQQIGLQFGLTYAVETSVAEKKVYSTYTSYKSPFNDEEEPIVNRHEIQLWNKASIIIPDTPDNRIMLEQLYSNLITLIGRLKEFTSSSEKMLEFISSNVKMLNT